MRPNWLRTLVRSDCSGDSTANATTTGTAGVLIETTIGIAGAPIVITTEIVAAHTVTMATAVGPATIIAATAAMNRAAGAKASDPVFAADPPWSTYASAATDMVEPIPYAVRHG